MSKNSEWNAESATAERRDREVLLRRHREKVTTAALSFISLWRMGCQDVPMRARMSRGDERVKVGVG